MRRDDPQYESDCYERVQSARRLVLLAIELNKTLPLDTAFQAASRLLARRVAEYAEVLNGRVYLVVRAPVGSTG